MGQRLSTHPLHPKTGQLLDAIYVSPKTGREFYPILGAAEDDDEGSEGDGDEGNDEGDEDDDTDDSGDGGDDDDAKGGKGAKGDTDKDAITRLEKRMKAADRRASAAEKKVKEYEDANKSELEKAEGKVKESEAKMAELTTTVSQLQLENAFLRENTHSWADPEDALELAQRRGYLEGVVDEDGDIDRKALKAALDKLAKEKKHLLANDDGDEDEDDTHSTDSNVGSTRKRKKNKQQVDEAALRRQFPALNQ